VDPTLHLRPMEATDIPSILLLMAKTPQAPIWREQDYRSFLRSPDLCRNDAGSKEVRSENPGAHLERRAWVLCCQASPRAADRVVGFAGASLLTAGGPPECELEFIAIAPEHRRHGGGAALMEAVFDWARSVGSPAIRLEVRASNLTAIRLYQRLGFLTLGRRRAYYREPEEDALQMQAPVDAESPPGVV
jgi:ribosomal protein S18 acetylase RimI-like enzyme